MRHACCETVLPHRKYSVTGTCYHRCDHPCAQSVGALELAEELTLAKGSGNPVLEELRKQSMGVSGALMKMVSVASSTQADGLLGP